MIGNLLNKLLNVFMATWRYELFPEDVLLPELRCTSQAKWSRAGPSKRVRPAAATSPGAPLSCWAESVYWFSMSSEDLQYRSWSYLKY